MKVIFGGDRHCMGANNIRNDQIIYWSLTKVAVFRSALERSKFSNRQNNNPSFQWNTLRGIEICHLFPAYSFIVRVEMSTDHWAIYLYAIWLSSAVSCTFRYRLPRAPFHTVIDSVHFQSFSTKNCLWFGTIFFTVPHFPLPFVPQSRLFPANIGANCLHLRQ